MVFKEDNMYSINLINKDFFVIGRKVNNTNYIDNRRTNDFSLVENIKNIWGDLYSFASTNKYYLFGSVEGILITDKFFKVVQVFQ